MNSDIPAPNLGPPPNIYDQKFFEQAFRSITLTLQTMRQPGVVRCSKINVSMLPTSSVGLRSGDVWNDTGTLKVV